MITKLLNYINNYIIFIIKYINSFFSKKKTIIVISGNIGVGKTTLCEKLKNKIKIPNKKIGIFFENYAENQFLKLYYEKQQYNSNIVDKMLIDKYIFDKNNLIDIDKIHIEDKVYELVDKKNYNKYAILSQLTFLIDNHNNIINEYIKNYDILIFDRYFFDCTDIFSSFLYEQHIMSSDEYKLFTQYKIILEKNIPPVDFILYLYASPENTLLRINNRNRENEKNMDIKYINKIFEKYKNYFKQTYIKYKCLNTDNYSSDELCDISIDIIKFFINKNANLNKMFILFIIIFFTIIKICY